MVKARGKGLALEFMNKCIKKKGIWLEVAQDNVAAINLYKKFGFEVVGEYKNKLVMKY